MDEDLKRLFAASGVPHELEAQRRAWTVVRKAYAEREPLPRRRTLRPLLAAAAVAAVLTAAVSPPGRALGDWIRDTVRGQDSARPALFRLPTGGRLLVESARGPWVVQPDGSKRLLGRYAGAGFSPRGLFLVVTSGRRVVAVEPDGDPRWTVTRPEKVGDARWAPGGLVVAYRAGGSLRVVDGDGTDDRVLARRVAPVPPAWRPRVDADAVAYVDGRSRVRLVETGSRRPVWTSRPLRRIRELVWSPDGSSVLVVGTGARQTILDARGRVARVLELPDGHGLVDASFAPDGRALAYTRFERESGRGAVVVDDGRRARTLQSTEGRLQEVVWSPDRRWLLVGWPDADQWLFLRLPGVRRIVAVADVRREFDPGGEGGGPFPRVVEWCCAR